MLCEFELARCCFKSPPACCIQLEELTASVEKQLNEAIFEGSSAAFVNIGFVATT